MPKQKRQCMNQIGLTIGQIQLPPPSTKELQDKLNNLGSYFRLDAAVCIFCSGQLRFLRQIENFYLCVDTVHCGKRRLLKYFSL